MHYKGFSFKNYQYDKSIVLTDVELVNQDILNHIFTRKGERVNMPTWGTLIPDLLFEQMDEEVVSFMEQEIRSVLLFDPRVQVLNLTVTPLYDRGIVVCTAVLRYIELNLEDRLDINLLFKGQ